MLAESVDKKVLESRTHQTVAGNAHFTAYNNRHFSVPGETKPTTDIISLLVRASLEQ